MKFCDIILFIQISKQAHKGDKVPPMAPGSQLGNEMRSQICSLYKTPDY